MARRKPSRTRRPARDAVLPTTELLENVLVHLPVLKLFSFRRISKQFRDAIDKSPAIQAKMMLRSLDHQDSTEEKQDLQSAPAHEVTAAEKSPSCTAHLNSLLIGSVMPVRYGVRAVFNRKMLKAVESLIKGVTTGQSWELMQITTPPCNLVMQVVVDLRRGKDHFYFERKGPFRDPLGVKLGALFDDLADLREVTYQPNPLTLERLFGQASKKELEVAGYTRLRSRRELLFGEKGKELKDIPLHVDSVSFRIHGLAKQQELDIINQGKSRW